MSKIFSNLFKFSPGLTPDDISNAKHDILETLPGPWRPGPWKESVIPVPRLKKLLTEDIERIKKYERRLRELERERKQDKKKSVEERERDRMDEKEMEAFEQKFQGKKLSIASSQQSVQFEYALSKDGRFKNMDVILGFFAVALLTVFRDDTLLTFWVKTCAVVGGLLLVLIIRIVFHNRFEKTWNYKLKEYINAGYDLEVEKIAKRLDLRIRHDEKREEWVRLEAAELDRVEAAELDRLEEERNLDVGSGSGVA